jgi:L-rhamnose mutarotase
MKRYSLTLNLKNDAELIQQYEQVHKEVWPEIINSIKESGIENMEIYRYETRLFMIMEVNDNFSFEMKNEMDKQNEIVQKWEKLMWRYQQALPGSAEGEKWKLMNTIFELKNF